MQNLLLATTNVIQALQKQGIHPILYGSEGVSLYLGPFKQFSDIDLLIPDSWIQQDWQQLIRIMQDMGFTLQDEHEHEFINAAGDQVNFASQDVLIRDGISDTATADVISMTTSSVTIQTLTPEAFLRAYQFSEKDGYRKTVRGKKDRAVISLLQKYLSTQNTEHK